MAGVTSALSSQLTQMQTALSERLDQIELKRALRMWNLPEDHVDGLIAACDIGDSNGKIDYKEFVDILARDTVTVAAMGKRDMQAKQAMGVDAQAFLADQMGHKVAPKHAYAKA